MAPGNDAALPRGGSRAVLGWSALVFALSFAAFSPALGAGFLNWDDPSNLLQNPHFRGLSSEHLAWMFSTSWLGPYQPLSWLSLAVDHALWGLSGTESSPEAWGYHLTNVVLHALAAAFVFLAARRLFARVRPAARGLARDLAAVFAALVFAVHPLRAESVVWVTERRDVLSGMFFALCLWAWFGCVPQPDAPLRLRRKLLAGGLALAAVLVFFLSVSMFDGEARLLASLRWGALWPAGLALFGGLLAASVKAAGVAPARRFALAVVFFAASLLSKGTGMTLPVALLAVDVLLFGRLGPAGARLRSGVALVLEKAPWLALSSIAGALALWGQRVQGSTMLSWEDHTLVERLLQCAHGLVWYPWKTLVPLGLVPIVELPPEIGLDDARFALPLLVLAATTLGLVLARRRAAPVAAALVAFALLVAPVLGLTQAGAQLVADRYSYLPGLPLCFLLGGLALAWGARAPRGALGLGLATTALFGVLTFRQARVWTSSESLWEHALATEPESPAAHQFLGIVRRDQAYLAPDPATKRALFHEALELFEAGHELGRSPRFFLYLRDVRAVLVGLEPERRAEHVAAAVEFSRRALDAGEAGTGPHARLDHARMLARFGEYDEALSWLDPLGRALPESPEVWRLIGLSHLELGRARRAEAALQRACALEPGDADCWGLLGRAREELGEVGAAVEAYQRALQVDGTQPTAIGGLRRLGVRR